MISRFLVFIQGGLGSLFYRSYLSGGLTLFGEQEEQQKKGEHILYPLSHSHPHPRTSLATLHYHPHSRPGVLILLVLFIHFHYL